MNKMKQKQVVCIGFSILISVLMVVVAEQSGEMEILFPEIAALTTGALVCRRQPWEVSKLQLVLLMTISAVVGVCIVRLIPFPLYIKVLLGFSFVAVALTVARCSLAPMISACILPILMGTKSVVYPVSVAVLSTIIVCVQALLEYLKLRETRNYVPVKKEMREAVSYWGKLLVGVALLAFIPTMSGNLFFIAPPLIVVFTEFSNVEGLMRKAPVKAYAIILLCAATGVISRYLVCVTANKPLFLAAVLTAVIINLIFKHINMYIPPAGACAFLPFIIQEDKLLLYPFEVAVGCFGFMVLSLYLFRTSEIAKEKPLIAKED